MKTLERILILCKVTNCELSKDLYGRFTVYTPYKKVVVSNTDLNEALHYLRMYLKNKQILENTFDCVVE